MEITIYHNKVKGYKSVNKVIHRIIGTSGV